MTTQEKEYIKQTMNTNGWLLIMAILKDALKKQYIIKTKDRSYEDIAVECMANEKVDNALKDFMNKLLAVDNDKQVERIDYT